MKPVHFILLAVIIICFGIDQQTGIFAAATTGLFFILHIYNGVPSEPRSPEPRHRARPKNQPRDPNE